jgi:hypothetical protein
MMSHRAMSMKPPKTTYVNNHAHHCYVISPRGQVEWMANGVNAQCESPDGTLVGTNDRFDFLVFDRAGNQLETRNVEREQLVTSKLRLSAYIRSDVGVQICRNWARTQ